MTILAIILTAAAFLVSLTLTAIIRKTSLKTGFVAKPAKDRYHQTVIPLGGGIAIFTTIASFLTFAAVFIKYFAAAPLLNRFAADNIAVHLPGFIEKIPQINVLMIALSLLFAVGLYDDKKHLSPFIKLIAQFTIAVFAVLFADIRIEFFIHNTIVTTFLSAFWIVLLINVFNFLDNMDGASAGIAIITVIYLFTAAAINKQIFIGALALLFIGTTAGFLVFNFPPAKIFMGDAGSLLIGFLVAVLSIKTTYFQQQSDGRWYAVFMPLIILAVPLYDFTSVTLLRLKQGKSPFVGDTQHFSHRLKRHGLTDTQTVLTLYLAAICTGLGATFFYQVNQIGAILIFAQTFMILAIIAIFESTAKNDKNKD